MNNPINVLQDKLIEEFELYESWMDKYEYIIELGKELKIIDNQYKKDEYLIKGCQSQVWLHSELNQGKMDFTADSDAIITKGLIGMVIQVFNHQSPKDIVEAEMYMIDKIGLNQHLSPTRSNGFDLMIKKIKMEAGRLCYL